ncbi:NAD(P)H-binding protein [Streptomyces sp. NPDC057638]|uniref:NAD(P)H-binding protein n=1 Tax=Streptomyces sp. NPDC057638 TaxID=3346190 RepID=UPI0036849121
MILVTGATGNIGGALLGELLATGAGPVRALSRDLARAAFPDGVEGVEGDIGDPASLAAALDGVRSLFLVSGMGSEEEIITAARRAGVEHVVLVSSIVVESHPHLAAAREKREAEQALRESGLAWTVLRPTQFASNALWWAETIRAGEPVLLPYPEVGLPTVHPADIAAVARVALTEPGHRGRVHTLTGPELVTARGQLEALGAALGREVPYATVGLEEAHRRLATLLGDETADAVLDLTGRDLNDALVAVRDTVSRVTGEPGRTVRQWAVEHAAAFR